MNLYDFSFEDIDGNQVNLEKFAGKPILIVNTASRCGFTPQYEDLQNLFLNYRKSDLTIIATTSNSFNQEYSDTEDIKKICLVNYGVGFVTSSPMDVKGVVPIQFMLGLMKSITKNQSGIFINFFLIEMDNLLKLGHL